MPIFAFAGVEAALEHMLPGRGQRQLQYFAHGLWLAVSAVDELEDAAERPFGIGAGEEPHAVARLDAAALQYAQIPAAAQIVLYLGGDVGHAEAFVEFPAGLAALADFEAGAADLPLVAEADLPFVCAFDAEVFAKAAGAEVRIAGELGLPVFVVVLGVAMQGFVGTAVVARVAHAVACQAGGGGFDGAGYGLFVDAADLAAGKGFGLGNADFADGGDGLRHDGFLHRWAVADYSGWAGFLLYRLAENELTSFREAKVSGSLPAGSLNQGK